MIKINLALKKQAIYTESAGKSIFGGGAGGSGKEFLTNLFPRMILPVLIALGANYGYDYWVDIRTEEMNAEISAVEAEKTKFTNKLNNYSGFESKKAELNGMLDVFSAKVGVFDELIKTRDSTLRALITLSMACPKDVWLNKIKFSSEGSEIQGRSMDIALISEVMEKMGVNQVFRDVKLKTTTIEDQTQQTVFEITAEKI